jgi:hypothetical protein
MCRSALLAGCLGPVREIGGDALLGRGTQHAVVATDDGRDHFTVGDPPAVRAAAQVVAVLAEALERLERSLRPGSLVEHADPTGTTGTILVDRHLIVAKKVLGGAAPRAGP